ncbi:hypothetical protein [Thermocatellispora tengchongensis]|uniref:hypothetical protein n=1 Tax=Thermocatellispora tengchongensis TaxID=1073253 RepID=UPI001606FCC4|nr:hypothetical protein [Thermocatellispora tengchongensis]
MWITHLTVELRRAHTTIRGYHAALRCFCDCVTALHQGWTRECQDRLGSVPVQICLDERAADALAGPGRRPMTREEVQRFLDYTDDQMGQTLRQGNKGAPARCRDAPLFKVVYAWG